MRGGAGRGLRWLLVPAAAGVPLGLLWWWLAPTAQVQVARVGDDVVRYSAAVPELDAVQDVALLVPSVVFGVVTGLVVLVCARARPAAASALAAAGSLVGSGVAYAMGRLLGPAAIPVPTTEDAAPVTGLSPLEVNSWGVLLVWAVVALFVMTTGHLAAVWSTRTEDGLGRDGHGEDRPEAGGLDDGGRVAHGRGPDEGGRTDQGVGAEQNGGVDQGGRTDSGGAGPDDVPRGGGPQRVGR